MFTMAYREDCNKQQPTMAAAKTIAIKTRVISLSRNLIGHRLTACVTCHIYCNRAAGLWERSNDTQTRLPLTVWSGEACAGKRYVDNRHVGLTGAIFLKTSHGSPNAGHVSVA